MAGTITLYGRNTSANVQKVVWALEELELPYERLDIGGAFGGVDTPEYTAMNPNKLVPTLKDGGLTIWESNAIVRYLAAAYGHGKLWPEYPVERAIVDQWTDWAGSTFQPAWLKIFMLIVRVSPAQQDAEAIRKAVADTTKLLKMVDDELAKHDYLTGSELSYADIVTGVCLYRWTTLEIERPDLPNVEAWHERLLQRPAFVKAVNISYDAMRAK